MSEINRRILFPMYSTGQLDGIDVPGKENTEKLCRIGRLLTFDGIIDKIVQIIEIAFSYLEFIFSRLPEFLQPEWQKRYIASATKDTISNFSQQVINAIPEEKREHHASFLNEYSNNSSFTILPYSAFQAIKEETPVRPLLLDDNSFEVTENNIIPRLEASEIEKLFDVELPLLLVGNYGAARAYLEMLMEEKISPNKQTLFAALRLYGSDVTSLKLKGLDISNEDCLAISKLCPILAELDLTEVQLTDVGIKNFAENCKENLTQVILYGCKKITDMGVISLAENCSNLSKVDVKGCNQVSDAAVKSLGENCKNLIEINLSGCEKVTDEGIEILAENCKNLTLVDLSDCEEVAYKGLVKLGKNCKNLSKINLSISPKARKNVSSKGVYFPLVEGKVINVLLKYCKNLTVVNLSGRQYVGNAVETLVKNSKNLTEINLANCNVSNDEVKFLAKCKKLSKLNLNDNDRLKENIVKILAKNCRRLTEFELNDCYNLTDESVFSLAKNCKNLTKIDLLGCYIDSSKITDAGVISLSENCKNLTKCYFNSQFITDAGVSRLAENCKSLMEVGLDNSQVTDAGVASLAENCKNLSKINLKSCFNLTFIGVESLAKNCKNLSMVNLTYCWRAVTNAGVKNLIENCKKLKWLDLRGCRHINADNIEKNSLGRNLILTDEDYFAAQRENRGSADFYYR